MAVEEEQVQTPAESGEGLEEVPVLTVRDTVVFPGALAPITVGRPASVALVQCFADSYPRVHRRGSVLEGTRGTAPRVGAGRQRRD